MASTTFLAAYFSPDFVLSTYFQQLNGSKVEKLGDDILTKHRIELGTFRMRSDTVIVLSLPHVMLKTLTKIPVLYS